MEVPVLNKKSALERIGGDEELYDEVVEIFFDDTPGQLQVLKKALLEGDRILGERQAHSLKSAAANIGAEAMQAACLKAERSFKAASPEDLAENVRRIELEFATLSAHFKR